jgi:diguanylate cyclase (GGDEF)-like protein
MNPVELVWKDKQGLHRFLYKRDRKINLGRSAQCDVHIGDPRVSRLHATLEYRNGLFFLEDAGSATGTFVNGEVLSPLHPIPIQIGQIFTLGPVALQLLPQGSSPVKNAESTAKTPTLITTFKALREKTHAYYQLPEDIQEELRHFEKELERQLLQFQVLQRVTDVLGQILDIKTLLRTALDLVGSELGADRGFVILYDSSLHQLHSMVTWHYDFEESSMRHEQSFSKTLAQETMTTGELLILDNAMTDPRFQSAHSILASRIQSVICIPLFRGEEIIGVIYLDNLHRSGQFQSVHHGFLMTFARQASLALHNAKLYTQAVSDDLSGLFLRKYVEQRIREEIARYSRQQHPFAILMIDIDHFKSINDRFGHTKGDEVIVRVAKHLQSLARTADVVSRYGGEEFLMLLPQTTLEGARSLAERLREKVASVTFHAGDTSFSITISLGIASYEDCFGEDLVALINSADQALYQAKREGRNCVRCALP